MSTKCNREKGFTMVETLVAFLLSVFLIGAVMAMFLTQRRTIWRQKQLNEMHQGLRMAMDIVSRDVRMAGYGVPESDTGLWLNWVVGMTNSLVIGPGLAAGDPDEVSIAAAFDEPVSHLASDVAAGATVLSVTAGTGLEFDNSTRKTVLLGQLETFRVVFVAGDSLTISTDPALTGDGLTRAYPAGTPLELVKVITYSLELSPTGFPHRPYMLRDDNTGELTNDLQKMVAVGIDDLQATFSTNMAQIMMRVRATAPEMGYTDPDVGDQYRRESRSTTIRLRNTP